MARSVSAANGAVQCQVWYSISSPLFDKMARSVSAANGAVQCQIWYSISSPLFAPFSVSHGDSLATDKIKKSPLPGIEPGSPA
jgi:hypothetical protein